MVFQKLFLCKKMGSTTETLTVPAPPHPRCAQACGGGGSGGGSLLDESFSLLTCTTVFTFFHHSEQIPAGLLALFSLARKKNNKKNPGRLTVYLPPPSASGPYY